MKNILLFLMIISFTNTYSQLQVNTSLTPAQYVSKIAGSGVMVSNATYTGDTLAIGDFVMLGNSILDMDSGVLLTSGKASNASGSVSSFASYDNSGISDPQLASLVSATLNDASVLEFDFMPISDTIKISYVFASEEYPEYSLAGFTDAIGLFITGDNPNGNDYLHHNIALVPATDTAVNIGTINNGTSNTGPCINCSYYIDNSNGLKIAYDGLTTTLTAWALVSPFTSYHFKIAIADAQDAHYDSGVFIKAGSFNTIDVEKPEICNVGIDNNLEYNRLIWGCADSTYVDSFYVYRESALSGNFDLIDSLPFAFNTVYYDSTSNPQQMAYRYKVSAFGAYNFETPASAPHQTMFLNVSAGLNNEWILDWSASEGADIGSYKISRGTDSLSMQILTSVGYNVYNYVDNNPPSGTLYYQVETALTYPCNTDTVSQLVNFCFSNLINTNMAQNISISQNVKTELYLNLFPNPNNGSFTLEINTNKVNSNQRYNIEIYSPLGKLVYQDDIKASINLKKSINLESLNTGVYFIRIRTNDDVLNTKFVLE